MDDILGEIGKGFLRGLGYIIAEIFFKTLCFWIGWPFCKVLTFGKYPRPQRNSDYWAEERSSDVMCSLLGLTVLIVIGLYLLGIFK